jgi:hypothetical protein
MMMTDSGRSFDPERVKYVRDVVAALSEQTNRAEKAERQVRDLSAANAKLREKLNEIGPLVEFFRDEGFWPFGHRGDYEGWIPEQTAVHFLREHLGCVASQATTQKGSDNA